MMSPFHVATARVRLVRGGAAAISVDGATDGLNFRAGQVREEMRGAAGLAATDARWVLAARTAAMLEGGRAAILSPERRRRLLVVAGRMGLRPFDASMVIAVVQDAARSGEGGGGALGVGTEERLGLIRPVARGGGVGWMIAAAVGVGAAMFVAMVRWLGV